mmetsp:Transcript_51327/g.111384  ORF Transcript_51327/g.111384 Transcript_51327/m.111384 type:complete len:389 (-) Transcript_51327:401-1567(-)
MPMPAAPTSASKKSSLWSHARGRSVDSNREEAHMSPDSGAGALDAPPQETPKTSFGFVQGDRIKSFHHSQEEDEGSMVALGMPKKPPLPPTQLLFASPLSAQPPLHHPRSTPRSDDPDGMTTEQLLSLVKVRPIDFPPVPNCFLCPITKQTMVDPVMAADGANYERGALEGMFLDGHRTSPVTGQELMPGTHQPNLELRTSIEGYMALRLEAERQWANLEVNMKQYVNQMGRKLDQKDQQVKDLEKQVQNMEGNPGNRSARSKMSARSMSVTIPAAGEMPFAMHAGGPSATRRGYPVSNEDGFVAPPPSVPTLPIDREQCPFSAGPAPRSARGAPPARPVAQTSSGKAAHTPRGAHSPAPFAGLRAALTPRLVQMVRTPRTGGHGTRL